MIQTLSPNFHWQKSLSTVGRDSFRKNGRENMTNSPRVSLTLTPFVNPRDVI